MESFKLNENQFRIIKKYCSSWKSLDYSDSLNNKNNEELNTPISFNEKEYLLIENFYQFFTLVTLRYNGIELFPEFEKYKEAKTNLEIIKNINIKDVSKILTTVSKYENMLGQDSVILRLKPNLDNFDFSTFEFSFWNIDYDISLTIEQFLELFIVILKHNINKLSYPNLNKEIKILENIYDDLKY